MNFFLVVPLEQFLVANGQARSVCAVERFGLRRNIQAFPLT